MNERIRESYLADAPSEEPVDARRYLEALRRRAGFIFAVSVGVSAIVLLVSLGLAKSYRATAQITPTQGGTAAASNSAAAQQDLATIEAYVKSPQVLVAAARRLNGESGASLNSKITTSLDTNANIVNISASDRRAARAARLANTVAETFLSVRAATERVQLARQQAVLTRRLQTAQTEALPGLVVALEQQISNLAAQEAAAGSDVQLLAPATAPSSPSSPRPVRNAVFAFLATLFLLVLGVAGRELMAPSISDGRELGALIGVPILGRVPRVAGRRERREGPNSSEAEAYRFVSKSLELAAWPHRPRLVAVTSAVRGEGKTTVVSRLGVALAEMGNRTLLVSADLHWPKLHAVFGLRLGTGFDEVVSGLNRGRPRNQLSAATQVRPNLYVLTSGRAMSNPTTMLTNDVVQQLVERMRKLDLDYVLFDLPPLLAVAETQLFARQADAVVLASFVGRTSAEQLVQTREMLDRLAARPLGVVVLGARGDNHPAATGRVSMSDWWTKVSRSRNGKTTAAPAREQVRRRASPRPK